MAEKSEGCFFFLGLTSKWPFLQGMYFFCSVKKGSLFIQISSSSSNGDKKDSISQEKRWKMMEAGKTTCGYVWSGACY